MRLLLATAMLCLCTAALPAAATLEGVTFGTYISGPELSAADLQGRVVFWEYWGVNCPPCRRSISHLTELKHRYGDQLVMVANHCQSSDPAGIRSVWTDNGGDTSITVIDHGNLPGNNVTGIPRCFVFDHTGALLYSGSPFEVDAVIEEACAKAPGALVADREWTHLEREAFAIGRQQGPIASAIDSVREASESDDAAIAAEGKDLLDRVVNWAQEQEQAVASARGKQPLEAWETANKLAKLLKGDELGEPFEHMVKEMRGDRAFKKELKAAAMLGKIEAVAAEQGITNAGGKPEAAAACRKALEQVIKRYEGTVAANRAEGYIEEWKL